jgi:hypothetical protein
VQHQGLGENYAKDPKKNQKEVLHLGIGEFELSFEGIMVT